MAYRTAFGVGGVVAALTRDLGPLWYPVVLALVALPAACSRFMRPPTS